MTARNAALACCAVLLLAAACAAPAAAEEKGAGQALTIQDLTSGAGLVQAYLRANGLTEGKLTPSQKANVAMLPVVVETLTKTLPRSRTVNPLRRRKIDRNGVLPKKAGDLKFVDPDNSPDDSLAMDKETGIKYMTAMAAHADSDDAKRALERGVKRAKGGVTSEAPPTQVVKPQAVRAGAETDSSSPAPKASTAPPPNLPSLAETGAEAGVTGDYYVVARAFIPGPGSKAAAGVKTKSGTLGFGAFVLKSPAKFSKSYGLSSASKGTHTGYGGYVLGYFETDEVFDSSHRDYSFSTADNKHSKTYVQVVMNRRHGKYYKRAVSTGCSKTHHYCDTGLWPLWSKGLCCSKQASAPGASSVKSFRGSASAASFTIQVRKGNPCVPGSYYAGPIMHTVKVKVDFAKKTVSVSGTKSLFPAFEILHGYNPSKLSAIQFGVRGRSVYDLMDDGATFSTSTTYL